MPHEARRDTFLVSDDPAKIDRAACHAMIGRSYWAKGIPRETMDRAIEGSITFGVFDEGAARRSQVGLARVISDGATYAYLCDVFIDEAYRGRGLSKFLVQTILSHPRLQGLRRFCLLTKDAHGLYEQFGFGPLENPLAYMDISRPGMYERPG